MRAAPYVAAFFFAFGLVDFGATSDSPASGRPFLHLASYPAE